MESNGKQRSSLQIITIFFLQIGGYSCEFVQFHSYVFVHSTYAYNIGHV